MQLVKACKYINPLLRVVGKVLGGREANACSLAVRNGDEPVGGEAAPCDVGYGLVHVAVLSIGVELFPRFSSRVYTGFHIFSAHFWKRVEVQSLTKAMVFDCELQPPDLRVKRDVAGDEE